MTFTNEGADRVRDLIYDDIDKGQLGTGGTASTVTDTDLETADATTLLTTVNTKSDQQVNIQYNLPSTGGTTSTYKEFKLQNSTNSADYDRIVFTGIAFTNNGSENLNIIKRYFIRSV